MGNDITAGHTYSDTAPLNEVNGSNLNSHVNDAVIKATFISAKTAKSPLALADEFVINDGGTLKKGTLQGISDLLLPTGAIGATKLAPGAIHDQTEKTTLVDADEFLLWDSAATALKRVTRANAFTSTAFGGARKLKILYATAATLTLDSEGIVMLNPANAGLKFIFAPTQTINITASGANGLDTGAEASNTWYYIWAISDGTNYRGLLSVSSTSPTMPSGYTYKLLVGVVRNDGSSNFVPFYQYGDEVYTAATQVLTNTAPGSITVLQSLSISSAVPPNAISCKGTMYSEGTDPTDWGMIIAGDSNGVGASMGAVASGSASSNWLSAKRVFSFSNVPLITAQTVYWTAKTTAATANIGINGYRLNVL